MQGVGNASESLGLTLIYNQTRRSVVLISVTTPLGRVQGSGFVYDLEGRIITNNHVVEEEGDITVTFIDGTIVPATRVGRDPYVDLAVIDVDVDNCLSPLNLGNSSELLVGEQVVAIGNPFGLAEVVKGGPAEEAGLRGGTIERAVEGMQVKIDGDVIIGVDGRTVMSFYDLVVYLERYVKPGDTVKLTLIRENSVVELKLTLGIRPPRPEG